MQEIHEDSLKGDYTLAEGKAARLQGRLPASCSDCVERLRLLQAELFTMQGKSKKVVALLAGPHPPAGISSDSHIKEDVFLSLANASLGNEQLSTQELHEAQNLVDSTHSNLNGELLQSIGIMDTRHRRYVDAKKSFTDSLTIARRLNDKELEAGDLLDLGYMALEAEHYGEAMDWFNASSEIAKSIQAQPVLEQDLGNVGWAYYELGDYEVALAKTVQAEDQARKLDATGLASIHWLKHASLCRQQLGDLKGAKADYLTALNEAQTNGNKKLIASIHWGISLVYLQLGELHSAKSEADQARDGAMVSGDKPTEVEAALLEGLIAERQGNDAEAMRVFTGVEGDSADSPSVKWQVENAIATLTARGDHSQDADAWFQKSIATFESQRSSVKSDELKLPFFANGDALYRDYANYLIASNKADQALRLLDFGRARSLYDGLGSATERSRLSQKTAFDPRAVAHSQNATILFYSLGPEKSWLWATDAHGIRLFTLPKKSEIESNIAEYQKAILKPSDPIREQDQRSMKLYDMLVAPAASMIPQGSKVILVPDGALNQLNFETLLAPGKDGRHYWIEDAVISNANSIRLLSSASRWDRDRREKSLLLMGNTVVKGTEFETLPNAAAEVGTIESLFPAKDRLVLTQADAVPSAYAASKPAQFSYIHFVAHGTASRLSPLDSAVILSPSAKNPDNYKLYARDIIHQPIHADLVTISACNGSGIRAYAGEGLVGLSWAFLRAGSHNVIGGLWNVDDASTLQLMNKLYGGLKSGDSPDIALRNAKLSLIHSDGIYRKPLFWAAFQLYVGS